MINLKIVASIVFVCILILCTVIWFRSTPLTPPISPTINKMTITSPQTFVDKTVLKPLISFQIFYDVTNGVAIPFPQNTEVANEYGTITIRNPKFPLLPPIIEMDVFDPITSMVTGTSMDKLVSIAKNRLAGDFINWKNHSPGIVVTATTAFGRHYFAFSNGEKKVIEIREGKAGFFDSTDFTYIIENLIFHPIFNSTEGYRLMYSKDMAVSSASSIRPGFISAMQFVTDNHGPLVFVTTYDNSQNLPIEEWYIKILSDKEYTFSDSHNRIIKSVMVGGIPSLQVRSTVYDSVKMRTFVPGSGKVFGIEIDISTEQAVPDIYLQMIDTFRPNK